MEFACIATGDPVCSRCDNSMVILGRSPVFILFCRLGGSTVAQDAKHRGTAVYSCADCSIAPDHGWFCSFSIRRGLSASHRCRERSCGLVCGPHGKCEFVAGAIRSKLHWVEPRPISVHCRAHSIAGYQGSVPACAGGWYHVPRLRAVASFWASCHAPCLIRIPVFLMHVTTSHAWSGQCREP